MENTGTVKYYPIEEKSEKYLFGTPRPLIKKKKVHFRVGTVVDTPHFNYK